MVKAEEESWLSSRVVAVTDDKVVKLSNKFETTRDRKFKLVVRFVVVNEMSRNEQLKFQSGNKKTKERRWIF